MAPNRNLERVPELDGVRGLAILMVLGFHLILEASRYFKHPLLDPLNAIADMGWAGVDVFFVLSGFLITSILLRSKKEEGYFVKFYARRVLRIFPVYYFLITFIFLLIPAFDPSNAISVRSAWPWYYSYTQNWGDAFGLIRTSYYLAPAWSLAIEEQFYIFWPAIVYFLDSRRLAFASLGLALFSLGLRLLVSTSGLGLPYDNRFFYYSTVTRLDSLLLGALVALALQSDRWKELLRRSAVPILVASLGLILFIAISRQGFPISDQSLMFIEGFGTYGFTIIAVSAAMLITLLSTRPENSPLRVVFRSQILALFGKYSYAIYLFHMPIVFLYIKLFDTYHWQGLPAWVMFILLTSLTSLLLALLSWRLIEQPALALKKHFAYLAVRS